MEVNHPRLLLIADGFTEVSVRKRATETICAACDRSGERSVGVHLRDHGASGEKFARVARVFVPHFRRLGAHVAINSRLDIAEGLGADLHIGRRGPSLATARKRLPNAKIGYSAHTFEDASIQPAPDYYFFSPIFPTTSKPGHRGVGLETLQEFCRAAGDTPVYALGGVTPARVSDCLAAGAYGVAVLSGILEADDPAEACQAYLEKVSESAG